MAGIAWTDIGQEQLGQIQDRNSLDRYTTGIAWTDIGQEQLGKIYHKNIWDSFRTGIDGTDIGQCIEKVIQLYT